MRRVLAGIGVGAFSAFFISSGVMAEPARDYVAVHLGQMTGDVWETVLFSPASIDFRDSYTAGVSAGREWSLFDYGYIGVEATLLRHWGEQEHWELSVPAVLRSVQPAHPLLPGLAAGLGLSYATDVPEIEVERKGQSQELLAYWFLELEFGRPAQETRPFLRLHHRSDAFGLFEADTGSNLVQIGLRHAF